MTMIHLVRHGEVHNPQGILYARLPRFRLSERGQQQAAAAGVYLQHRPLAAVFSSPMLRARQTAEFIARPHDLKVQQSELLNEVLTPHQGRPIAELDAEGWIMYEDLPPDYETPADLLDRVQQMIASVRAQYPEQEVAIVSHGDVVLSVQFWAQGITFSDSTKNSVKVYPATASITTLVFANGVVRPSMTYHQPY
jgi:broad specificity phosphatase PhoE